MEMENGLSGAGANVEDGAVTLLDVALAGDCGCGQVTAANHFGVFGLRFFQSGEMFLGDDEHVRGRARMDVAKGRDALVPIDDGRRQLALDDALEQCRHRPPARRCIRADQLKISLRWSTTDEADSRGPVGAAG